MTAPAAWQVLAARSVVIAACGIMALPASVAHASQGPGTMPGTASPTVQTVMAFVVYGAMAGAILTGLVGALRR